MSQPPMPGGVPPTHPPSSGYGGYGGDLQSYGQPVYVQPPYVQPAYAQPPYVQPAYVQQPGPVPPQLMQRAWSTPELAPQRPGVVGLAATLAITASLQWICALSFCWLVATAGAGQLGNSGVDGGLYHILNRFNYRMLDGLAWPLYLFPAAAFVLGFLLLARRAWARTAYSVLGAVAVLWSAWWLRHDLIWWLLPALYVAVAVLVLWTRSATRWYGWTPASDPAGGQPS